MDQSIFFSLIITAGVCTLLSSAVLIWLGFRGKHAWASPYCRKCKYDLRGRAPEETQACPECGADLSKARAIGYVRHRARRSLVALGVLVLLSPGLIFGGLVGVQRIRTAQATTAINAGSPAAIHAMSIHEMRQQTDAVVVEWVAGHVDEPWGWDELEARLQSNTLSATDAIKALDHLIAHMKQANPNGVGYGRPLAWSNDYVSKVHAAGLMDDAKLREFIDAYLGISAQVTTRRVEVGHQHTRLSIEKLGSAWGIDHAGLPYSMLWTVTKVDAAGQPLPITSRDNYGYGGRVGIDASTLPAGQHELTVHMALGLANEKDLVGFNKDQSTIEDWPETRLSWNLQPKCTLKVYDPDRPPVTLTSDPSLAPTPSDFLITQMLVRPESGRVKLFLEMKPVGPLKVSVGMQAHLKVNGESVKMGAIGYNHQSSGQRTWRWEGYLDTLPADITHTQLVLTPDPSQLYRDPEVDQCWGEVIVIDQIPLERKDLGEE